MITLRQKGQHMLANSCGSPRRLSRAFATRLPNCREKFTEEKKKKRKNPAALSEVRRGENETCSSKVRKPRIRCLCVRALQRHRACTSARPPLEENKPGAAFRRRSCSWRFSISRSPSTYFIKIQSSGGMSGFSRL